MSRKLKIFTGMFCSYIGITGFMITLFYPNSSDGTDLTETTNAKSKLLFLFGMSMVAGLKLLWDATQEEAPTSEVIQPSSLAARDPHGFSLL